MKLALTVSTPLVRAGLSARLESEGFTVVMSAANVPELLAQVVDASPAATASSATPDAVIMECGAVESLNLGYLSMLNARWPEARVIGMHDGLPAALITTLHAAGIRPLFDRASGIGALLAAIDDPDRPSRRRWVAPTIGPVPLTDRESEVLTAISQGFTARQIALQLGVGVGTIEAYKQRAFVKLGATNQAQAVAAALRSNLLTGVRG